MQARGQLDRCFQVDIRDRRDTDAKGGRGNLAEGVVVTQCPAKPLGSPVQHVFSGGWTVSIGKNIEIIDLDHEAGSLAARSSLLRQRSIHGNVQIVPHPQPGHQVTTMGRQSATAAQTGKHTEHYRKAQRRCDQRVLSCQPEGNEASGGDEGKHLDSGQHLVHPEPKPRQCRTRQSCHVSVPHRRRQAR